MMTQRHKNGLLALFVGCVMNLAGDHLLGVHIELFSGLSTFNFLWFLDVFILPFFVGVAVAIIFGLGGKWLCYFPPLIVRCYSYFLFASGTLFPEHGARLMPIGWWGLFVVLTIEAAAFGGVIGEIGIKSTYGRRPRHLVYKTKEAEERNEN